MSLSSSDLAVTLPEDHPVQAAVRAAYRTANANVLRDRIDMGVAIFGGVGILMFLLEADAQRAAAPLTWWVTGLQLTMCLVAIVLARWERSRERLPALGALVAAVLVTTVVAQDVLIGLDPETTAIGLVAILACTSALFPWGWRAQLGVGATTVAAFFAAEWFWFEGPPKVHAHIGLFITAVATVVGAFLVDRYRYAAFQREAGLERVSVANREEAEISAALVEVGHTLGRAVGQPDVFDQVNRLIVDLLGCDWSATVALDPGRNVYRVVGLSGVPDELRAQANAAEFPADSLFQELGEHGMVEVEDAAVSELLPAQLFERFGVSAALAAPIVLGDDVVGAVTNGYTSHRGAFTMKHRRITAGVAQASAIAVANQRLFRDLARANRVKSDFVSTMSHELRTPVNVMLGFARVLEEGDAGPLSEEQRNIVARIRRSGLQLGQLVDGILDLSKLEAGTERLKLDWVDLQDLERRLDREFRDDVESAGLSLVWQNHAAGLRVRTEGARLEQIVRHLVQNAIKFTPHGEVRVELAQSVAALVISVTDSGIGIAPEDVETIFEEFHQVDGTDSRSFEGAGLGLHIVRRLVDRLEGSVAVMSEPGQGSVFTVEIPVQFARARGA